MGAGGTKTLERCDIVVVTHETLVSEWKNWNSNTTRNSAIFDARFLRIVIAEGDSIVNANLQRTKACMDLRGKYKWIVAKKYYKRTVAQMESFLRFLRVNPEGLSRSSSDRTKAFETLLEMRNEPLPHRGGSLDSLARPVGATMKRISKCDKIKSRSTIGAASLAISSPRYFASQLHEEPEEAMKFNHT
ncbi:hypothetical protein M407DRAFT_25280 [Tulasnella calospora MUT 4182]|uniref:Uncharacterized protein n=1 Tax=Tulasnella calospora MUT 4182 TaxID=1051891 RepID=A0A0C3Q773_9AGAM|nr:hypothetical protein M407DRAFT_25280 [Tulasnella calospora MUT 4182]